MSAPLSRRRALGLLAGAPAAVWLAPLPPPDPMPALSNPTDGAGTNAPAYHFAVGAVRAAVVSDGQAPFPPHPLYAPEQTEAEVEAAMRARFLDPAAYVLNANALVLWAASGVVVVDAGAGATLGPGLGRLPAHLAAVGVAPDDVAHVVLTHGHLDHTGGLTDPDGRAVYPNAALHVAEPEHALWTAETPDVGALGRLPDEFVGAFLRTARAAFAAYADRLSLFRVGDEVAPGVRAVAAPGHTPGHTALLVSDGSDALLHVADAFHHEAFDLAHPRWATAFDHDRDAAYRARVGLLDRAAADRTRVLAYHAPFPGIGHVTARPQAEAYGWEPEPWRLGPPGP